MPEETIGLPLDASLFIQNLSAMLFLNDNVAHYAMNLKLMDIVQCFPPMQHFVDTFRFRKHLKFRSKNLF